MLTLSLPISSSALALESERAEGIKQCDLGQAVEWEGK